MADETKPPVNPPAKPPVTPPAPSKVELRAEFDGLLKAQGLSLTPESDDPKETRKKGPKLTDEQARRLHDLHKLIA